MTTKTELAQDYKEKTRRRKLAEAALRRTNTQTALRDFNAAMKAEGEAADKLSRYVSAETGRKPSD